MKEIIEKIMDKIDRQLLELNLDKRTYEDLHDEIKYIISEELNPVEMEIQELKDEIERLYNTMDELDYEREELAERVAELEDILEECP